MENEKQVEISKLSRNMKYAWIFFKHFCVTPHLGKKNTYLENAWLSGQSAWSV